MYVSVLTPTPMIPDQMTGPLSWYRGSTAVQKLVHHVFDKYLRSLQGGLTLPRFWAEDYKIRPGGLPEFSNKFIPAGQLKGLKNEICGLCVQDGLHRHTQ